MTNNKHIPKRRFEDFKSDGEWGQESLGKIVDFSIKTNSLSREKLSLESYEVQNIHYGDVLIKFDNVLDLQRDSLPSIIDSKFLDFKESLLQDGDLIFADAAEDSTVGKAIEIRNIGGKNIVSGLHTIAARPTQLFAPYYLGYYINSNFYHDQILPLMQGTKVSSISKSNLQVTKITFPTIDEQKKLGKFFQTIDSLIALHQHKLDKLKNLKKAYLAELFPAEGERLPKRRFPGFEGEWEEKKLGEVVEFKRGLTYTPSSISKTGIRVLRSSNIDEDQFVLKEDDVFVDESKISIPFVEKGDILITAANGSSRLVGKHAIIDSTEKMVHGGFMLLAKSDQYKFINALLSSNWYTHFIDRSVLGGNGAIGNLSKSDLENEVPLFPSDEEQKQIGEFFQKLDKSISLQQQKLDKLKDLKKAYLNELFV